MNYPTTKIAEPGDPLVEWGAKWGAQADGEGWSLFECADSDHEPVELQAIACPDDWPDFKDYAWKVDPEFPNCDDQGAWRHVIEQALAGSEMHQATLMCLHRISPGEFTFITRHTLGGVYA